ncbi:MAG: SRPBCC family protein [Actinomycetes bacterium]
MASVRRELTIRRSVDDVWARVGDPTALNTWFPGVAECVVNGTERVITTEMGLPIPEEIVTVDDIAHRFQYRITAAFITNHLASIDVFELEPERSLVVYSTNCEPEVMALIIGGSTGAALVELRRQLEIDLEPLEATWARQGAL